MKELQQVNVVGQMPEVFL